MKRSKMEAGMILLLIV